jgi:hypothetical protein
MKRIAAILCGLAALMSLRADAAPAADEMKLAVETYFSDLFGRMSNAVAKAPTETSFRDVMKAEIVGVEGLFGGSLIDASWVIREVLYRRDGLAVGVDLAEVKELDGFRTKMAEAPGPQLSEPGQGGLFQPRLISMRYPVMKDGKMDRMVSIMVRTEAFLSAVKLDKCKAFRITCLGKLATSKGKLSKAKRSVTIRLPSTEWVIEYE